LRTVGEPDACTIAYTSDVLNIFKVGDAMESRGWTVNRLQRPECLQIQIGSRQNFDQEAYVQDLKASVEDIKTNPDKFVGGLAGVYGLAANLADAHAIGPIHEILCGFLDTLYLTKPAKK
jgi:sphinganine-1-phosphate aldolase